MQIGNTGGGYLRKGTRKLSADSVIAAGFSFAQRHLDVMNRSPDLTLGFATMDGSPLVRTLELRRSTSSFGCQSLHLLFCSWDNPVADMRRRCNGVDTTVAPVRSWPLSSRTSSQTTSNKLPRGKADCHFNVFI